MNRPRHRLSEWLITLPSLLWLTVLFLIPTLIVFAIAFKPADPSGGVGAGWTLRTVLNWSSLNYPGVIWRTFWISTVTTALCIFMAVPCAYYIARTRERLRQFLILLVIVPFWTNFLIRVFAWKVVLHTEGWLKKALVTAHCIPENGTLLYTPVAVLLVMVYTYLPFAILPIYAAAEKFDFRLIEAARDLGARSLQAFFKVFIPAINRGVATGPNSEMLGNKIAQRTFVDRNLPHASWLAAVLTLAVLAPMIIVLVQQNRRKGRGSIFMEGV